MPHCHDELYRFFFYANYVFVALHVACIRGDRGRTGCGGHRGGATTARERLQVGPSPDGMRSYFTFAFSQTITTPPFYRRKLPFTRSRAVRRGQVFASKSVETLRWRHFLSASSL